MCTSTDDWPCLLIGGFLLRLVQAFVRVFSISPELLQESVTWHLSLTGQQCLCVYAQLHCADT